MLCDDWFKTHKTDSDGNPVDPKKRLKNWWYYNKWLVLGGLVLAVLLFDFGRSIYLNHVNRPDFQVACLGTPLPQGTVDALEQALAQIGPDLNGDGQVRVRVNCYAVCTREEPADPAAAYADQTKLFADIQAGDSFLFLMENPEAFQEQAGILTRLDGTFPLDTPDSELPVYLPWSACPVLTGLELGRFTDPMLGDGFSVDNQLVLEPLFLGHRSPSSTDSAVNEACEAFWRQLIAGATPG